MSQKGRGCVITAARNADSLGRPRTSELRMHARWSSSGTVRTVAFDATSGLGQADTSLHRWLPLPDPVDRLWGTGFFRCPRISHNYTTACKP